MSFLAVIKWYYSEIVLRGREGEMPRRRSKAWETEERGRW
jgi:hypothetical protein